jgi:glutathione synthase
MLWEAQARNWKICYFEQKDLFLRNGIPYGYGRELQVSRDPAQWFTLQDAHLVPLAELDVVLMRKNPPFNEEYIYTTYILEQAELLGVLVVNRAQALRDANEKMFTAHFPECCPPTLVTQSIEQLYDFWHQCGDIVCKPLNGMGGAGVFRVQTADPNAAVIFSTLTDNGSLYIMAQQFLPEIKEGDKRILLINGQPLEHVLVRVPQEDWRGNLAVGAKGQVRKLSQRDRWICSQIGPELRKRGLYFVGLDVIGDYLTEINVTSPTGIRELDTELNSNISAQLLDYMASMIL